MTFKAVSQLLWPHEDREVWFSLEENHEKGLRFGLHQLRNRSKRFHSRCPSKRKTLSRAQQL